MIEESEHELESEIHVHMEKQKDSLNEVTLENRTMCRRTKPSSFEPGNNAEEETNPIKSDVQQIKAAAHV